mmetsp:Transcript_126392/g.369298  ORF Transcript_126392/g.369298 Transcript_126392/m.369298 type:complete len:232 (-) Transcript_126392:91-786(-)
MASADALGGLLPHSADHSSPEQRLAQHSSATFNGIPPAQAGSQPYEASRYWWYWQAYRTWVPYNATQVAQIEAAFNNPHISKALATVDIAGTDYELLFEFGSCRRPHQVRKECPGRHREAKRLYVPERLHAPECTLRSIGFDELLQMEKTSGHAERLTKQEQESGRLDMAYQRKSMEQTAMEQLGRCSTGGSSSWIFDLADPSTERDPELERSLQPRELSAPSRSLPEVAE